MSDIDFAVANEHALYYAKVAIGRAWHQARKAGTGICLTLWPYPGDEDEDWQSPPGVVSIMEAEGGEIDATAVWIDADRGLRTLDEAYWFGYWDARATHSGNLMRIPYILTTNDIATLHGRFEPRKGLAEILMPYACISGIASSQDAANLFAGDQLHTMPYRAYLKTDHWAQTRLTMIEAAGERCQLCNAGGILNVHHRTYDRRGFEDQSDLIVLCSHCHAKFHDKLRGAGR